MPIKKRFVLSLITNDNDYQLEQAANAEETASRLGVDLQILYADSDAITQSQQLLQLIQGPSDCRPDAILLEPVGTGLAQVAEAAARVGIAWGVVNREVDYVQTLRLKYRVPVFSIGSDHKDIGQIQARQMCALLPTGGLVLYIQGPSYAHAAQNRTVGMMQVKPANIQLRSIKADWTEEGACKAVTSWLRLSTSHELAVAAIVSQNDLMAKGARKAFQQQTSGVELDRWMKLPYLGCDGLRQTGMAWVRSGQLTGTVVIPPGSGMAIEMMLKALTTGSQPAEQTLVPSHAYPEIDELAKSGRFLSFAAKTGN